MAIAFPSIDPVIVQIGPLAVRWYSLAYIGGVLLGWLWVKRSLVVRPLAGLTKSRIDDLVVWAILGIILGGRLGYTLIYNPDYYLAKPLEILHIWQGGMSFHGGFVGFALAFAIFCRKHGISYFSLMDRMAVVAPIGLGFGRIANFINGELWGRVSDVPWAVLFPRGGELPRHPSQLYEAFAEGLLLFALLLLLWSRTKLAEKPGALCGVFLMGYAVARIACEHFREPDAQLGFLWAGATMGQLLSLPMFALGAGLYVFRMRRT